MAATGRLRRSALTVLFMLVTTLVFVSVLTGVNLVTRERVAVNQAMFIRGAILEAAGSVPEGASVEALNRLYDELVVEHRGADSTITYYGVGDGVVLIAEGPGLWGEITAAVGLEKDLKTLTGIAIIDQNETPGLGGRISEEWFTRQFAGKRGPFSYVPEGTPTEDDEFDAITGATTTTSAIRDLLNRILAEIPDLTR